MSEEKKPCPLCNGVGRIEVDDLTVKQCICAFARAMKEHLGPEIALARSLASSPLFVAGDPKPKIDRTGDDLFLKGYWVDLLSHFKSALAGKGLFFSFKIVTDERLRTVYLGGEKYSAHPKNKRDEMATNNSLSDLVGPDIDLVIIRLGFLGYKNVAMPGILKEALMLRAAATKPTWIVEDPSQGYFGPGHLAYSEDLAEDIDRRFKVIELTNKKRSIPEPEPESAEEDVDLDAPIPVKEIIVAKPRFVALPPPEIDTGALGDGEGPKKYKSTWKKSRNGGSSGGGPLG